MAPIRGLSQHLAHSRHSLHIGQYHFKAKGLYMGSVRSRQAGMSGLEVGLGKPLHPFKALGVH